MDHKCITNREILVETPGTQAVINAYNVSQTGSVRESMFFLHLQKKKKNLLGNVACMIRTEVKTCFNDSSLNRYTNQSANIIVQTCMCSVSLVRTAFLYCGTYMIFFLSLFVTIAGLHLQPDI